MSGGDATRRARAALARAAEPGLGAFLYVDAEGALAAAAASDRRTEAGDAPRILEGVPVALKDNLVTRGVPTTCASRILEGWVPPYDAHVVARLRAAGAVPIGKTNLDEFGMGSSTERSAFGPTANPFHPDRVPGGSSGGSAAAVAAGVVPVALGSDTGGSVRQPAAFCGVFGLRPTWGRVSRRGLVAFASSLDQVGVLAATAGECARGLQAIAGPDPGDATCARQPVDDWVGACAGAADAAGVRVGLLRGWLEGCDAAVRDGVLDVAARLEDAGARVVDVAPVGHEDAVAAYYVVASAEASSNLARFDGLRYGRPAEGGVEATRTAGFGPEVVRRILLGTFVLSAGHRDAYYDTAMRARAAIRGSLGACFERVDVLLGPTAPTTAFRFGEKLDDPVRMYLSDVFTLPPSLADLPALSAPAGLDPDGLPLAYQLVAPPFREATLLATAAVVERTVGPLRPARRHAP